MVPPSEFQEPSLVSRVLVDQWLEWVSDEVNVPRELHELACVGNVR